MDGSLNLTAIRAVTSLGCRIIGTMNLRDIAVCILDTAFALDKICVHQTDFIAREHTEIFFRRYFHEIFPLNIKLSGKRNLPAAKLRILEIVLNLQIFYLSFRIIVDDNLDRI